MTQQAVSTFTGYIFDENQKDDSHERSCSLTVFQPQSLKTVLSKKEA